MRQSVPELAGEMISMEVRNRLADLKGFEALEREYAGSKSESRRFKKREGLDR
ncbi:MAG: hypothetical protein NUW23_07025 [Firmicutes bacterium]|jgi:hypothetical protein|nr:hypothetical protein [Bacillota bacterium]